MGMPENAIVVTNQQDGDYVAFTVRQEWVDEAGLAVRSGRDDCMVQGNKILGATEDFEGECLEGIANVVIVVYLDKEFDPDECEACDVYDLADMGGSYEFCAYRVEIPCDKISVECGSPSAAPSGAPNMCYYNADMVQINKMNGTDVTIQVNNVWTA